MKSLCCLGLGVFCFCQRRGSVAGESLRAVQLVAACFCRTLRASSVGSGEAARRFVSEYTSHPSARARMPGVVKGRVRARAHAYARVNARAHVHPLADGHAHTCAHAPAHTNALANMSLVLVVDALKAQALVALGKVGVWVVLENFSLSIVMWNLGRRGRMRSRQGLSLS